MKESNRLLTHIEIWEIEKEPIQKRQVHKFDSFIESVLKNQDRSKTF
ncbi:hypothetical protein LEP1GSC133_1025 [Leptospira borgpetersenii serovar Pomona str. 200901868]|uniref:Uncharacterized protein n=1 Tax=Leptospira borgpetersenii serovar Pomona str. 200901868 TaxID=1192866 RepID=M6W973_LEPBO|nr:hypothetical protein LEP1GSC133_1025 [Leptospira borgpetersenii serovar Pomona str. 200901868]